MNAPALLIVPGIGNSGPGHWQTRWEQDPAVRSARIRPTSWDHPDGADWVDAVRRAVHDLGPDTVIVAHSLGCLAAAHVAAADLPAADLPAADPLAAHLPPAHLPSAHLPVRGLLLVAPPDVAGPQFPAEATGFADLAGAPLTVPSVLVSSTDDPYCAPAAAARLAATWGAEHVVAGAFGHLNAASGLGDWPAGRHLLDRFT